MTLLCNYNALPIFANLKVTQYCKSLLLLISRIATPEQLHENNTLTVDESELTSDSELCDDINPCKKYSLLVNTFHDRI